MEKFRSYVDSLDYLRDISLKKNEYLIKKTVAKWPTSKESVSTRFIHTLYRENLVYKKEIELSGQFKRVIAKQEAIKRFHPNIINNKDFWVECRKRFPLLSVSGQNSKNVLEVNKHTLSIPKGNGFLRFINSKITESDEKLNFLEIGFGYGNVFHEIGERCNYYGIDYVIPKNLKKYKNFAEIDKSGIPDYLDAPNFFDIVYSVNVFQHCSQEDRFKYIRQAYDVLKPGGCLMFTEFVKTDENSDKEYWGIVDKNDRGYTHFFNQLTECDWDYELAIVLSELGFKVIHSVANLHHYSFIVKK